MNRGNANRKRLLLYLLATWLLLWSLFRMLLFPQQLASDSASGSFRGLFVIASVGLLTIAWAFGGPLLLSNWGSISERLAGLAVRPGKISLAFWLLPTGAWFLAYSLFAAAWPLNPAMVDGPVIVLVVFGLALVRALATGRKLGLEPDDLAPMGDRRYRPRRPGETWISLPPTVRHILAATLLGLIVLLWFREALFDPNVTVYGGDIWNQHYDLEAYASRLLRAGQFPFWNPYIYSGVPFSAHPQSLLFYPPQLILRMLPLNLSISWAIAFHVWIAGAGMFALARKKGLNGSISFLCALVFMLNGGLLLRIFAGHIWLAYALCWLPLVWLFVMVALDSGGIGRIVTAAAGTAMIILTGHPAFPIYILLFFGCYWLWKCYVNFRREKLWSSSVVLTRRFLAILALAFGLSAIQIIPTLVMYSQVSLSDGYGAGGANFLAISLADLTALFVPNFYVTGHNLGHYWELLPYLGVPCLLLIPFSYAARRADSLRDYLSASALASLAIALGSAIGIYFVLYYLLPPFRVARIPPRSLVIFIPAVTLLAGIGLQAIYGRYVDARLFSLITRVYQFLSPFILGIALGVWLRNGGPVDIQVADSVSQLMRFVAGALLLVLIYARLAGLTPAPNARASQFAFALALAVIGFALGILFVTDSEALARQLAILGLLVALFTLLLASIYRHGPRPLVVVGLIILVFADLFISGRLYIRPEEPPTFYQNERLALKDVELRAFDRVLSYVGEPNQYMLGQVGNIDGYNSGILSGYERFLRGLSGATVTSSPWILLDGSIPDTGALSFLGTRYILTLEPIEDGAFERNNDADDFYLYENSGALPRAFVVYDAVYAAAAEDALQALREEAFDYASQVVVDEQLDLGSGPGGESAVEILRYTEADGGLLIRVETSEPGILVLSEPYYSERQVSLDGRKAEMLRVNLGFIGLVVPAGSHDVELSYGPTSLYIGGIVTAFSMLLVAATSLYSIRRSSRRRDVQEGSRQSFG